MPLPTLECIKSIYSKARKNWWITGAVVVGIILGITIVSFLFIATINAASGKGFNLSSIGGGGGRRGIGDYAELSPGDSEINEDWEQVILDRHNELRAKHGEKALTWSKRVRDVAQRCAKRMNLESAWSHICTERKHILNGLSFGENGYFSPSKVKLDREGDNADKAYALSAVNGWYSEIRYYNWNDCCGYQYDAGHFTQVVWRNSSHLGCGIDRGPCTWRGVRYPERVCIMCNYYPPGNTDTRNDRDNVHPIK